MMVPVKTPKDRKSFTLLEVMVAICIFSMIASISGWQIFRMILEYRFNNQEINYRNIIFNFIHYYIDCTGNVEKLQAL